MPYELRKTDADVLICEGARVSGDVALGRGVNIWYNAVIRGDDGAITIGEDTNVQDCAVLHEETRIGAGCTIGHGAIVHGCTVGENSTVGMGAVILNGARIGKDCMVAGGAVVTGKMDAPDASLLVGNPARVVRPLRDGEIADMRENAEHYIRLREEYR